MTIVFSGHRPNKLGGYNWKSAKNQKIILALYDYVENIVDQTMALEDGNIRFICGGALGIDQMAFEICYKFKQKYPDRITLILAMPFEKQDNNWISQIDKDRLKSQRERADKVVIVDTLKDYAVANVEVGEYHPAKMVARNRYMVDQGDAIIAVFDGSDGGTGNCVNYARRMKRYIHIIDPRSILSEQVS